MNNLNHVNVVVPGRFRPEGHTVFFRTKICLELNIRIYLFLHTVVVSCTFFLSLCTTRRGSNPTLSESNGQPKINSGNISYKFFGQYQTNQTKLISCPSLLSMSSMLLLLLLLLQLLLSVFISISTTFFSGRHPR